VSGNRPDQLSADDLLRLRGLVDAYADAVDRRDGAVLLGVFSDDGVLRVQSDDGPVENEWRAGDIPGPSTR
jgi:hypothetical protein